tara:strand:+ start:36 stop:542 length:507 start_codon:yes stop_codon:yes gene_type:complete
MDTNKITAPTRDQLMPTENQPTISLSKEVKKKKGGTKMVKFKDKDMVKYGWKTFREFMSALMDNESKVYSKAVTTFQSIAPSVIGVTVYYNNIGAHRREDADNQALALASHLRFQGKSEPIFAKEDKNGNKKGDQIGYSAYLKAPQPKLDSALITANICSIPLDLPSR